MSITKKTYPENWREISNRIRSQRNYTCEYCHKGRLRKNPLTTHHLDNDPMNNEDSNLVLLHSNHHLLFHSTYKLCKTRLVFDQIVKNIRAQTELKFIEREVGVHV